MTTNTTCNRNNENAGFPDITNITCNRSNQNIGGIPDTQPLNHSASRISRHNKNHVLPKSEWCDTMLTSITCYTCHSVHGGEHVWLEPHTPPPAMHIPLQPCTPQACIPHTVGKRAVRILLECCLVEEYFHFSKD